jgi:hypothetical protein
VSAGDDKIYHIDLVMFTLTEGRTEVLIIGVYRFWELHCVTHILLHHSWKVGVTVSYSYSELQLQWAKVTVSYSYSELQLQWTTVTASYSYSELQLQRATHKLFYVDSNKKESAFLYFYVIFLKFLYHKYRLQLFLNCENSECFLTLPFHSTADNILLQRRLS